MARYINPEPQWLTTDGEKWQIMAQEILDEAFERGQRVERLRCARIVCPDCAKGVPVDRGGEHILETIQGHASWSRTCLAKTILDPTA